MLKDIIIIGSGGYAQEVYWCIQSINIPFPEWNILGFASERAEDIGKEYHGYEVLDIKNVKAKYAAVGFSDPIGKRNLVKKYDFIYPSLIHPDVTMTIDNKIGKNGVIIFAGTKLMPCCSIGDFTYMNVNVVIGHNTVVEKYSSFSPCAAVMGNCVIGECSYIGVSSCTREKVKIGAECIIGAGASVVNDIPDYSMAVGVPAKVIKSTRG